MQKQSKRLERRVLEEHLGIEDLHKIYYYNLSPDLENNSTCWDYKHNAKGEKWN